MLSFVVFLCPLPPGAANVAVRDLTTSDNTFAQVQRDMNGHTNVWCCFQQIVLFPANSVLTGAVLLTSLFVEEIIDFLSHFSGYAADRLEVFNPRARDSF